MFNFIKQFFRSNYISVLSKISIKDILNKAEENIKKIPESKGVQTIDKVIKKSKWQTHFPFTFFFGGGKFQPLYFFVSIFSFLGVWMLYIKIHAASLAVKAGTFNPDMISTADLTVVLGFVSSLILLYNTSRKPSKKESNN